MADRSTSGVTEERERRIDIASAALLAVATVLAAWSAFQSAKWSGEQATAYAEAAAARQESVRSSTLAGQLTILDVSVFEQFVDAYAADDVRLQSFYLERARDEFRPALDAWIALEPRDDPEDVPGTPFELPEYELAANVEAERQERQAVAGSSRPSTTTSARTTTCCWRCCSPRCSCSPASLRSPAGTRSSS